MSVAPRIQTLPLPERGFVTFLNSHGLIRVSQVFALAHDHLMHTYVPTKWNFSALGPHWSPFQSSSLLSLFLSLLVVLLVVISIYRTLAHLSQMSALVSPYIAIVTRPHLFSTYIISIVLECSLVRLQIIALTH